MTSVDVKNIKKKKSPKAVPKLFKVFFFLLILTGIGLVIYTSQKSYYQVDSHELLVIKRLGKYNRTMGPGLHFLIPFGIETAYRVSTRTKVEELGFRTVKADIKSTLDKKFEQESIILTGDLNLADVRWLLQYHVTNAPDYLFNVNNVQKLIRDIALSAMQNVVGDTSVSDVITIGRNIIGQKVKQIMQKAYDSFKIGITIDLVSIRESNPPKLVMPSFNEVNEARQEKEKTLNQAWEHYNSEIPKAEGEAKKIISEAKAYFYERINRSKGDTNRFLSLLVEYEKAPLITKKRLYFETLEDIIPGMNIYINNTETGGILPFLNLANKLPSLKPSLNK